MKLIAPDYYIRFKCTAAECRHNCCIGWEIDIDKDTYSRYCAVEGEFGRRIRDGINHGEEPTFMMDEQERCVFLNDRGLCDIITELGEDALCDICRDHPRFRNFFTDRVEIGLGLCCEEACRLILCGGEKVRLIELEGGEDIQPAEDERAFYAWRESVIETLQDRSIPFGARLRRLTMQCGGEWESNSPADWASVYSGLERMDNHWDEYLKALRSCDSFDEEYSDSNIWEQLAVYFVYRHTADGLNDLRMLRRLAFCVHAVRLIHTLATATGDDILELCRLYSCEIEYSDENIDRLLDMMDR